MDRRPSSLLNLSPIWKCLPLRYPSCSESADVLMRLESVHIVCRNTDTHLYSVKHGGACTRWHRKGGILNPASMKQALVEGAERIPGINLYEQGAGKMNLLNSTVGTLLVTSPRGLAKVCALCNGWAALPHSILLLMSLMPDCTWWA